MLVGRVGQCAAHRLETYFVRFGVRHVWASAFVCAVDDAEDAGAREERAETRDGSDDHDYVQLCGDPYDVGHEVVYVCQSVLMLIFGGERHLHV